MSLGYRQRLTRPGRRGVAALCGLTVLAATFVAPAAATTTPAEPPAVDAESTSEPSVGTLSAHTADADVLRTLAAQGEADFAIAFTERADLSAAYDMADWDARGAWVAEQLRATAEDSQRDVRAALDEAGVDYETFWMANVILVEDAPLDIAEQVIAFDDVSRLHEIPEVPVPSLREEDATTQQTDPVEWGIEAVGADRVWAEVGVRGEEIVVAGIDTGVQFDHPALADRYRGRNADGTVDHDYNWYDPSGICGKPSVPCDNQGHGTHTMGTAVGGQDDAGVGIGVAPGATWIAAKGCENANGVNCSLNALLKSGQWTLEPTDVDGQNPRADLRPHIVNNSWGADSGPIDDPFYDQIVNAWNASGIFAVFSNGNDGANGCRTVGSPADSLEAYGVGAYDAEGTIATFSSRGPGADGQVRPNISAPGVAIRSALPGDRYALGNGTSMASPHVAGAAALLWSAAPALIGDVRSTRELLDQTAVDAEDLSCGGTAENNNVYGEGRLDARAAVAAAPTGPTGTLTGVVTDAQTGEPLPRVTVSTTSTDESASTRRTTTGPDGRYSIVLSAGDHELQFDAYGYRPADGATVTVTTDETTTHDTTLDPLPTVTLSGTVTDGSGHGWPLYAALTIDGYPHGPVHTDPETGRYEVDLPADTTYSILFATDYEGYVARTEQIAVGSSATTADVALSVDAERHCPALGYEPTYTGEFENFDSGDVPDGWTVETSIGDGWTFANLDARSNDTGGTGEYAMVDSNAGKRIEGSVLTSPAADLSDATHPELAFRTEVFANMRSTLNAEVSLDGGQTWEVVWSRRTNLSGPHLARIPLPQAVGVADARVRFDFDGENKSQTGLWQLDDVLLGEVSCTPVDGGMVVGQVTDDRTDLVLDGATVTVGDATTTTVATPDDQDLIGGFFWLFTPDTGAASLTAQNPLGQHHESTVDVTVEPSRTTRADVALSSGELMFSTSAQDVPVVLGETAEQTVTVTNVGTAPASFEFVERDAAMKVPDPNESQWTRLADVGTARMNGLLGVHDDMLVYFGGSGDGASPISQRNYTYSIRNDEWKLTGDLQDYRSNPAGGFIGDLMYVLGGDGGTRGEQSTVWIYDPATDTMEYGTDAPYPFSAPGHAVYDDRFFVFGGFSTDGIVDTSLVYDPATDTWESIAPYPERAHSQMCGTIDGTIYCAGGVTESDGQYSHLDRAYGYRPETDEWFRIADLPISVTGAGYTAANGLLLISGGLIGGYRSNAGFYYDPAVGTWQDMPRSLFDLFNVGSGCGFYKVSGTQGRPGFFPWVEMLPGFDDCDTSGGDRVDWVAPSTSSATVEPGESMTITVDVDTSTLSQPGDYAATLMVLEDTPHTSAPLTVSLDVEAPPRWGVITGTVTGLARCDASSAPMAGATVRFVADDLDDTVTTDSEGRYTYYLPVPRGRLEMTASADGMVSDTRVVRPAPGRTKTEDVDLRTDEPCAVAQPGELDVEVAEGGSTDVRLTLSNADGAAGFDFTATDTSVTMGALPAADTASTSEEPPEWTDAAPIPGGRRAYGHAQCATDPNTAYVIGGKTSANPLTKRSWRYDAAADTWTEIAQIPATSDVIRAVCDNGRIHAFVGGGVNRHFVYDIARDQWSEAAPLPRQVDDAATAAWEGKLYVAGGTGDGDAYTTLNTVYVYDVATDTWSEGETMPTAATLAGFTQRGPELYVVGGVDRNRPYGDWDLDTTQRLDLTTGQWSTGPSLIHPRSELGAVATSEALYAIGGRGTTDYGRIPTETVQRLSFSDWDDGAWRDDNVTQLPEPTSMNVAGWCTTGRAGGEIWATGGGRLVNRALYLTVPGETCYGVGPDASWLSLDATGGTVEAGDDRRLTVSVNAADLVAGQEYTATIVVTTSDPGAPVIRIPVRAAITT